MMQTTPLVLSIQSHVSYGHVGNSAAALPLQLLNVQPILINTVQFSNHTGYGEFKGQVFSADHIKDVIEGLRARGVIQRCQAILSGYLGDAAIGEVILETVTEIRKHQPQAIYLCDPVMGDVGRGLFVRPGIPEFHKLRAITQANIITPNQFEFENLTGTLLKDTAHAKSLAQAMIQASTHLHTVIITSLRTDDLDNQQLSTLVVTKDKAWIIQTPFIHLDPLPNGMGDTFSAILLAHLLHNKSIADAAALTVSSLYALVSNTQQGQRDLPLIAQQQQITQPNEQYRSVEC